MFTIGSRIYGLKDLKGFAQKGKYLEDCDTILRSILSYNIMMELKITNKKIFGILSSAIIVWKSYSIVENLMT